MSVPRSYVAAFLVVGAIFAFIALTTTGLIPLESLYLALANYVVQVFAVTVLAALGGVFLGMLLAHRMLASRSFSPFEREILQTLAAVRARLEEQRVRDQELMDRLEGLEKRLR